MEITPVFNKQENSGPGALPGIAASEVLDFPSVLCTNRHPKLAGLLLALGCLACFPLSVAAITYAEWAALEFGSIEHPNAAPDLDPDDDGMTNIYEYAFMSDPQVSNAWPIEGMVLLHTDDKHYLALEFPQNPEATDLIYEVRASDAMVGICAGESNCSGGGAEKSKIFCWTSFSFSVWVDACRKLFIVRGGWSEMRNSRGSAALSSPIPSGACIALRRSYAMPGIGRPTQV